MGIKADFSPIDVLDLFNAIPDIVSEEIIRALSYLGEQCIARIRDRSAKESWYDQTGNLRSSVGYAVYQDGNISVESSFNQVKNGSQGIKEGKKAIIELAAKYAGNKFTLVILAGMEYAEYVEAMENKDVLASTELWARGEVDRYLQNALKKADARITKLQKQLGL